MLEDEESSFNEETSHGLVQVFILRSVLVNIFTNDTEELMECTLVKFADAIQL